MICKKSATMKNYSYLFISLFLWASCSVSNNLTSSVHRTYDDVKQEELVKYNVNMFANSIWKGHDFFIVDFTFFEKKKTGANTHLLKLDVVLLEPTEKFQDTLYFVFKDKSYPLPIHNIKYSLTEGVKTHTESKIKKAKDKEDKDIITTDTDTEHYQYNKVKIRLEIPDEIVEEIHSNNRMRVRFYIDDEAFDVLFRKFFTKKIRKVYSLENQYISVNQ